MIKKIIFKIYRELNLICLKVSNLNISSVDETLDEILNKSFSMSRYGSGEFSLIFGESISFQKYDKELTERLKEILLVKDERIKVCLPEGMRKNNDFNFRAKQFWKAWVSENFFEIKKFINSKNYGNAHITRLYLDYIDDSIETKQAIEERFKKMKKIWNEKEIVIIEGEKTRLGIGNDLFDNTLSIERILCPNIDAYDSYKEILNITKNVSNKKLILIALGPTATVLAYDLALLGYRALDIGHIDIEYEWFKLEAKEKVAIRNKYVNEAKIQFLEDKSDKLKEYNSQIIYKVGI